MCVHKILVPTSSRVWVTSGIFGGLKEKHKRKKITRRPGMMSAFQDGPEEVAFMSYKDHWHKEYKGIYVSVCVCVCIFSPFFQGTQVEVSLINSLSSVNFLC